MPIRPKLGSGKYYHVFNRSIAGFKICNSNTNYQNLLNAFTFYQYMNRSLKLSEFKRLTPKTQKQIIDKQSAQDKLVAIIAFCLMPTHFHLLLKQNIKGGISSFMRFVEDSYSRYFNILYKRKGPLWEGRFKIVEVDTDEQLLHLTRYIHLNPSSAGLVSDPESWAYSSYQEYIDNDSSNNLCEFRDIINLSPDDYKQFVDERIEDQRELSIIKSQLIDDYSG